MFLYRHFLISFSPVLVKSFKLLIIKPHQLNTLVLQSLKNEHPVIEKLLSYRENQKILSTYIDPLLKLAKKGQVIQSPTDLFREPYVFDFLKIPEPYHLSETDLEKRLIDNIQHFLLELGKGFAFIGRQYRITLANTHYYVDLVFYHRILKCFVLIDLKKEKVGYQDVGQMNMYLGYFENEENTEGDNPPIGIVLAKEKDELLVKYAMHNISSQLFVNKYQLYLPDKEELKNLIETQLVAVLE